MESGRGERCKGKPNPHQCIYGYKTLFSVDVVPCSRWIPWRWTVKVEPFAANGTDTTKMPSVFSWFNMNAALPWCGLASPLTAVYLDPRPSVIFSGGPGIDESLLVEACKVWVPLLQAKQSSVGGGGCYLLVGDYAALHAQRSRALWENKRETKTGNWIPSLSNCVTTYTFWNVGQTVSLSPHWNLFFFQILFPPLVRCKSMKLLLTFYYLYASA